MKVTPNYSARTFTIRTNSSKYRTNKMSKDEFESCEYNTEKDWREFLKTVNNYKLIK